VAHRFFDYYVFEKGLSDYSSIKFGIGEPLEKERFTLVKKYNVLYLSKKI